MGILDIAGVAEMPIADCGEELVALSAEDFVLEALYVDWGFASDPVIKLRQGVVERLKRAQEKMRQRPGCENWRFKVWDGFRTLETQAGLYAEYYDRLERRHSDWDHDRLVEAVEIFVSPASYNPLLPAPHNTGGAVDLTIVDGSTGEEVRMGTDFDEFNPRSYTMHFENSESDAGRIIHSNRMLLKEILEAEGFVNYFEEWWHFSYGDQEWAAQTGAVAAIYGSVELL
jgi:zinc D-Ala-D-Ala dipeptidase